MHLIKCNSKFVLESALTCATLQLRTKWSKKVVRNQRLQITLTHKLKILDCAGCSHTISATVATIEARQVDAFQCVRAGPMPQHPFHLGVASSPLLSLHGFPANHVLAIQCRALNTNDLSDKNTEMWKHSFPYQSRPVLILT